MKAKLCGLVGSGLILAGSVWGDEIQTLPPLKPNTAEQIAAPKEAKAAPLATSPVLGAVVVDAAPAWSVVPPRLSLRHDVGRGVGYENGYTSLEAFLPIVQPRPDALAFADVRAVNFDAAERWEFNAGGGVRAYSPLLNRVLGANAFYDGRNTDQRFFHQAGIGFEALGKILEFRANGYFILGDQRQLTQDSGLVPLGTVGGNTLFVRTQTFDVARGGVEVEAGAPLPFLERFYTRAYIGFYSYGAPGTTTANGIRGRLESQLSQRIALHFSVQNDQVFNTTVTGGLAIHFGGPAFRRNRGEPTWTDILGQRVQRDVNIVISQETVTSSALVPLPPPPPPPPPPEEEQEGAAKQLRHNGNR